MANDVFDQFLRLGLALAIGFLVGVERGWKHRDDPEESRAAGLRTHAIIGLLGGVTGLIGMLAGPIALAALTLAFIIPFAAFKYRETLADQDLSVTGAIAGLLVFALGIYAVQGDMRVAAAAGVVLTVLLAFKEALHGWLKALTWPEIQSALFILAASVIALPLLPDHTIDPWQAINPRELWMLTILLAGISFAGYVAVKWFGAENGVMLNAGLGALVSSTVVTADLGRSVRAAEVRPKPAAAAAALAGAVSLSRVCLLTGIAATPALAEAGPALIGGALGFALAALALRLIHQDDGDGASAATLTSPLELRSVLLFALFLGAVIVVGRLAAQTFGQAGLLPFAAIAGIGDVDSVALAAGSLMRGGLDASAGAHVILAAALVNTFAKGVIGGAAGGWRLAGFYGLAALGAALAGAATWFFVGDALTPMLGPAPSTLAPVHG